jgi:hypothetical protein
MLWVHWIMFREEKWDHSKSMWMQSPSPALLLIAPTDGVERYAEDAAASTKAFGS